MGTPTPSQRIIMRNLPCLSRTPGSATPIIRSLPKEVFLYEWWLVRAAAASNKNHLHVAGFTSKGRQVMEIFHSAAIVKRHGTVTLESVDGITISISGFINRFRTIENGFSKEVCDKFLLGFPYNWEEFATVSDRVSPSEANPQLSGTLSSSKYSLPVAFEDLPAVAIEDLLMSIPEDSESSVMNIVVENIWKSYAGSSCSGGKMTDCIKAHCSSCTGGKMTDSLQEDASNGMKYSFAKGNQTLNIANAVKHGHTVNNVAPEITSSVAGRVEILQNPEVVIITAGAGVRENMNSASEKPFDGSRVDSNASITSAGAGVKENMNSTSEKCLKGSWFDSHASKTNNETISGKEGHLGSLVKDNGIPESEGNSEDHSESEGNSEDHSVEHVVPQSCNESNKINVQQKIKCRSPVKDKSKMRETRSMKRLRKISFLDTSAMPDEVTPVIVLATPARRSNVPLSRCQVSSTSERSKPKNETEKLEESQKRSTLRRSIRLQNRKQHVRYQEV